MGNLIIGGSRNIYPEYNWATLPAPSAENNGDIYRVLDIGVQSSLWISNGTIWRPFLPRTLLARENSFAAIAADTDEHDILNYTVPAGLMGTNRKLVYYQNSTMTASINAKTFRSYLGAQKFMEGAATGVTQTLASTNEGYISNANAANVQKGTTNIQGWGQAFAALTLQAGAVDTTVAQTFRLTAQKAVGTEVITPETISLWLEA